MASGANIGMMDPAFFVGRRAIIDWLNSTFEMNITKIEDTSSGAVACQILDAIFPGDVPMSRVRWDAKSPHEFIDNYKIIQQVLDKKGIDKHIEVEKLMRAKYQDNLENMQWFKSFFERNYNGQPYDAVSRRLRGRGCDSVPMFASDPKKRGAAQSSSRATTQRAPQQRAPQARTTPQQTPVRASPGQQAPASTSQHPGAQQRLQELLGQINNMQVAIESLEKERDFYFGKLREIEILLQSYTGPDKATADKVFEILYATDGEDFVAADTLQDDTHMGDQDTSQDHSVPY